MMKPDFSSTSIQITSSFLMALFLAGCSQQQQASSDLERVIAVKALVVHPSDRQIIRTYTGSLEGEQQAVLYARLPEAVKDIVSPSGKRVKTDDIILTLDKYGPSSSYAQAFSVYENARKSYEKMKFLFAEGAISESQYDAARTEFEVTEAQFESVRRMLEIHTPIAGIVTSVGVSPGDLVHVGQALATVATTDRLRVKFSVNAEEVALVSVGDEVIVHNGSDDSNVTGKVVKVASSADPDTRAFGVEAVIPNPDGRFNPGTFVHVDYILQELTGVLAVPREAVLTLDNQPTVFVSVDRKAELRRVVLGPQVSDFVVVTSGLNAGDTLVILGQDYLENGVSLNVTELGENR